MNARTLEILPTCVPSDVGGLAACAQKTRAFAEAIHVDIDDGIFAPHLTWPYTEAGVFGQFDLSVLAGVSVEVHLMVENARDIGTQFARIGAHRIIGHIEGFPDTEAAHGALDAWRKNGASEVGLGLLMQTPFTVVEPLVAACDVVHLMTIVTIGTQGISYEPTAPARIAEFHARFPDTVISVDGGVSEKNIAELARAGAVRFGVGSALSQSDDPTSTYERLKSLAEGALDPVR